MIHDRVSDLVGRLSADPESDDLIQSIEAGAEGYVCPECGYDSGDPFVGMIEEPKAKIVLYCPVCNEHVKPLPEIFGFRLDLDGVSSGQDRHS